MIKDIGELQGKLLVFGGCYSNLQALEKLQSIAMDLNIPAANILCSGDVIGYCAQPEATVKMVRDWGIHCILGNVEIQLRDGAADCGCDFVEGGRCNVFSANWYPFAQQKISLESRSWMEKLPDFIRFSYAGQRVLLLHGGYDVTAAYVFASTPWPVKADQLARSESDVILAGHSGLPFSQQQAGQAWLNPGVIGMPANDSTTKVWYMLLETAPNGQLAYSHHCFSYDHVAAAMHMRKAQLPLPYAQTLETGLWDNTEILPKAETLFQGLPLDLHHLGQQVLENPA